MRKVIIQPEALEQIESAYQFIRQRAPKSADVWLDGLEVAIQTLAEFADWHPLAPESAEFLIPVRQILYGKRMYKYRVIYVVIGNAVQVLQVRRGLQRPLRRNDLSW